MTATSGTQTPPQFIPAEDDGWAEPAEPTRRCLVHLVPEEDGGYSALAVNLPGAVSQGESEEEALRNVTEALEGLLEEYVASGMSPPWQADPPPPKGAATLVRVVFPRG